MGRGLLDEITPKSAGGPAVIRRMEPELTVGVFAVWRDGGMDSQAANAFVNMLRARLAGR